jgi:hypothetical protein
VNGAVVSVQASIQIPVDAGRNWYLICVMPVPASSLDVDWRVTVPRTAVGGATTAMLGAVLSTRRFETTELALLPAASVASVRRS